MVFSECLNSDSPQKTVNGNSLQKATCVIHLFMWLFGFFPLWIHACIHSFFHSFILSFIHSFFHSFIHSLILSCFIHSFIRSFIHSFIHSCIYAFACFVFPNGHHFGRYTEYTPPFQPLEGMGPSSRRCLGILGFGCFVNWRNPLGPLVRFLISGWWQLKYFSWTHPGVWWNDFILTIIFFRWVGSTTNQNITADGTNLAPVEVGSFSHYS